MAQPVSPAPTAYPPEMTPSPSLSPSPVVSPNFCVPHPVDLTISSKMMSILHGKFTVTDINGNMIFRVKRVHLSLRDCYLLVDATDNPILTIQQKMLSAHRRWRAYRGDSTDSKDLIFTVKKSSIIQFSTELDVFLASNTEEAACDFKIKGSWFERSCTIHAGDTPAIVAQMHKKVNVQSVVLGKDQFAVTVYPNVDYAFIIALVVVLDEVNADRSD